MSKLSGLFVIARNSSFTYKRKTAKVQQVGRDLGVAYVLEGSVRKAGDRVRITAQLVDAVSGHHLWADRYDQRLDDVFAVQDEITHHIVDALAVTLTRGERERGERRRTDQLEAYDLLLRGLDCLRKSTRESNLDARHMFETATALDPRYAEAYAQLSHAHFREWSMGWTSDLLVLDQALQFGEQAVALDPLLPVAYRSLAVVLLWKKAHERAVAAAQRAVTLAPNDANSHWVLAEVLIWSRPEQAIEPVQRAMRLNPHYPPTYLYTQGHAYFLLRRYEDALSQLKRAVNRNPDWLPAHAFMAATLAELGRADEARVEALETRRLSPDISAEAVSARLPYADPVVLARVLEAFRAAGLTEARN